MSKKIFFIVLTCCLLVATFCVSFAGAPQVQSAPADIRAVLDRPDCASAPLIVPPVVEPLSDYVIPPDDFQSDFPYDFVVYPGDFSFVPRGFYDLRLSLLTGRSYEVYIDAVDPDRFSFTLDSLLASSDVVSSVSLFSLLYDTYTSAVIVVDGVDVILELSNSSFQTVTVTGNIKHLYLHFNSAVEISGPSEYVSLYELVFYTSSIVDPVMDTLVSGLRALGTNVGRAFSTMANAIFINADGTGLSTFGILVVVFAAVSLGLSLTRWTLNFCSSWGKRNR